MAKLTKCAQEALDASGLPDLTKERISALLRQDDRAVSSDDIFRPLTADERRKAEAEYLEYDRKFPKSDLADPLGIDPMDETERSLPGAVVEALIDRMK